MKMKKTVLKQIKEMSSHLKPDIFPPCDPTSINFLPFPELTQACQQFGEVYLQKVSPEKCYATGCLSKAELGEKADITLHIVDQRGNACTKLMGTPTSVLVSKLTNEKIECSVKKTDQVSSLYQIIYKATSRGRHQLHIKVEGEHIKGSPFPIAVKLPLQKLYTPLNIIKLNGVKRPWGVAVNQRGEIVVAITGHSGHCVSIFSRSGEKLRSFGSLGSRYGQFNGIRGVAVDSDDNILVVDCDNHRIQKFTSGGKFITAVGKKGNSPLELNQPTGIGIHPLNKKVYITEYQNHRVKILNSDLSLYSSFGVYGSGSGQFYYPWDVAFDTAGSVYVTDLSSHCVQVFTAEGSFLRKFGKEGRSSGRLSAPTGICIDSEDVVYVAECSNHRVSVFTSEGSLLTSFGAYGRGPGQLNGPCGIAVDEDGVLYVSDTDNHCLQLF